MRSLQDQYMVSSENQIEWDDILPSISIEEKEGCLLVPFGQKENGEIIVEDLAAIPHIIISGYSGSGKTTFVQTVFLIAANKYSSDLFKLAIFDSKQVDYQFMGDIPHLLQNAGVLCRPEDAFWDWLHEEAKRRYASFSEFSVQDISSYNYIASRKIPHIFVVIDDINTMFFSADTVNRILGIISIARRAGIHFFIVTSQVSSKDMPRDIASAITARIAFKSVTKAESKAAIGVNGAEYLETPGEVLYKGNNGSLLKLHTVYMPFDEAVKTVGSFRQKTLSSIADLQEMASQLFANSRDIVISVPSDKNNSVSKEDDDDYITDLFQDAEEMLKRKGSAGSILCAEDDDGSSDDLFDAAVQLVLENGQASTSLLQRKLMLGYARAARLIDEMEAAGIISPPEGSKPRQVWITKQQWLERTHNSEDSEDSTEENSDVHLRPFPYTSVDGGGFSVSNDKVILNKQIMTTMGKGSTAPQIDGNVINAIIFRKASLLSKGYFSFGIRSSTPIRYRSDFEKSLWEVEPRNLSEQFKIEISKKDNTVVATFLKQLSEDLSLPISYQ